MATLSERQKLFIVTNLAVYDSPSTVKKDFQNYFGVELSQSQISYYDPNNIQSANLASKWKDLFCDTREKFKKAVQDIPLSQKAYRLKKLQETMEKLEQMKNYKAVNETLEQAAKEMGGYYTNKTELTGKGGGPIESNNNVVFYLPDNGRDHTNNGNIKPASTDKQV